MCSRNLSVWDVRFNFKMLSVCVIVKARTSLPAHQKFLLPCLVLLSQFESWVADRSRGSQVRESMMSKPSILFLSVAEWMSRGILSRLATERLEIEMTQEWGWLWLSYPPESPLENSCKIGVKVDPQMGFTRNFWCLVNSSRISMPLSKIWRGRGHYGLVGFFRRPFRGLIGLGVKLLTESSCRSRLSRALPQ